MTGGSAAALRSRLESDADADQASLRTDSDVSLGIGSDVWRLRWRSQLTTAVAADANLHTTCGALLDAIALREVALRCCQLEGNDPRLDLSTVNVLVGRPTPGEVSSEADQALRSMREAVRGVVARVWYARPDAGWQEDSAPAPTWLEDDPVVARWLDRLLMPRLTAQPGPLALALIEAVDDPSLHLYPSGIKAGATDVWALRVDGLQIGTASAHNAKLTIGKPGKGGDGPQRAVFTEVFGHPTVTVSALTDPTGAHLSVPVAAERVRALLCRFREVDVRGAPITHRMHGGDRVIDEHALEARLLNGLTTITDVEAKLILDDRLVSRGSQFPTLWGHGGRARFLDVLLHRDETPMAVELKVATGGQGRYYRRSLIQAVLYRHFIRHAPGLEEWFQTARLDRMSTEGCVAIPVPARWTSRFEEDLELLRRVAERVGAQVYVVDDRATPDWLAIDGLPEPEVDGYELLSWQLAAALSRLWPRSLGRMVELHDCGGFYDQIQLQDVTDNSLAKPSPRPRVSLNRPGSAWVFSQSGSDRWTWREIWNYLAHGGTADEAAVIIGAMAGLGNPEPGTGLCFPGMAAQFLAAAPAAGWSWRCAWPNYDGVSPWVSRYRNTLRRYAQSAPPDTLPTIARIWGGVRNGEAAVIVDQQNLRTWVWEHGAIIEQLHTDPLERITAATNLVFG